MSKVTKILLVASVMAIILMSNSNLLSQENEYVTAKEKGLKIVLVVDVSPSVKVFKKVITDSVSFIFDKIVRPGKDDVHLITFSLHAKLYDPVQDKISCINHINDDMSKCSKDTYPKYALSEVFGLLENTFPEKVGVVLFLSDGENTQADYTKNDLYRTVRSLRTTGFTVYCIFMPTKDSSKERMEDIATFYETELYEITDSNYNRMLSSMGSDIMKAKFISPFSRDRIVEVIKNLNKAAQERFVKAEKGWNSKFTSLKRWISISWVVIGVVFVGGILGATWLFYYVKRAQIATQLNILWGKVAYLDNTDEKETDVKELSSYPGKCIINTPDEYPDLHFIAKNRMGRKVIAIGKEFGRVQYLDEERKRCKNQYIVNETRYIKLFSSEDENNYKLYKYNFLNILSESFECPVWSPDVFIGRKNEIKKIKDNFLKDSEGHFHCVITGMGNSGKSSLMKNLINEVFYNDEVLNKKYCTSFIGFDDFIIDDHNSCRDLKRFNEYINSKMEKNESGSGKINLLFIDDYDKLLDKFQDKFAEIIYKYHHSLDYRLILAGQSPMSLIRSLYPKKMPKPILKVPLYGLDNFTDFTNSKESKEKINSIKLINKLQCLIGLPGGVITDNVMNSITIFASSNPFIIKKILYEVIISWLNDYDKRNCTIQDVEIAINNVRGVCTDIMIKEACVYDEKEYNGKTEDVRLRDILNGIGVHGKQGVINKKELRKHISSIPTDRTAERKKGENFDLKLKYLLDMGFVIESNEKLIGIPNMFFDGESNAIED